MWPTQCWCPQRTPPARRVGPTGASSSGFRLPCLLLAFICNASCARPGVPLVCISDDRKIGFFSFLLLLLERKRRTGFLWQWTTRAGVRLRFYPKAKCLQRRSARRPGPGRTRRRGLTVTTPSSPRCLLRDARAPRADTAERRQDSDARARALIRAIEIYGRPPWTWMGRHGGRRDVAVALGRAREQLRPACAHPPTATGPPLVHFWFWRPPRGAAQVSRVRGGRRRIIGHGLHPAVQGAPGLAVASRLLVEGAAVACTQYKL